MSYLVITLFIRELDRNPFSKLYPCEMKVASDISKLIKMFNQIET